MVIDVPEFVLKVLRSIANLLQAVEKNSIEFRR